MTYVKNSPYSSLNLHLDSKNAIQENDAFTFQLKQPILNHEGTNMILSIKQVQIPNLFSNIRSGINNTIVIIGTQTGERVITIPEGYYNVITFIETFDALSGLTTTYNTNDLKLTMTSLTEDFHISSATTADYLGFSSNVASVNGVLKMPYIMDFTGEDYIFIKSNLVLRNINNLGKTSSTLVRVPMAMPYGYIILYNQPDPTQHVSHEQSIKNIVIRITDKEGRTLNLQTLNFQVDIEISFNYLDPIRYVAKEVKKHPFEDLGAKTPEEENKI